MSKAESQLISLSAEVTHSLAGNRLDQIAAQLFPDYSRARLQEWIKQGKLTLDGQHCRPRDTAAAGAMLLLEVEPEPVEDWIAQEMPLQVVYEDADLLVINKPADLVVHPAAGHRQGTLVNGLLHYCPALESVPRAGIVHRLDKDTTGLLVVAKNLRSHNGLVQQLQARTISRQYQAVVQGVMTAGGTVSEPLGRHPVNRIKRAVVRNGQEAVTHYRVLKRFRAHTHIQVNLETGRTHQIRVHMAHLKYPIVGDPLYNSRLQVPSASSEALKQVLLDFRRQALHAWKLSLIHPLSGKECSWESTLPSDFEILLQSLRDERQVIES